MSPRRRQVVFIGDGAVGKTSLLAVMVVGKFPEVYVPTVLENRTLAIDVKGEAVQLDLWDTAAHCESERSYIPRVYLEAHVILICVSIDSPDSLDNVVEKWAPDVRHFARKTPLIIVGCKKDLRDDPNTLRTLASYRQVPTTYEQGQEMARLVDATYVECSAKTGEGVREVLLEIAERVDVKETSRGGKASGCIIM
ncbi:hypothetical protein M408DRAFT_334237 [Serendipita vermifera MAFF 305830]|uniref:Uncharacterized protein n=1 Tax=Serendipita vermifera MAFF 305830 TaxID=933852 RepID=A0A0C2VZZ5_SERVB|nr:hypothetical protein M408DRAFT_334237 [Serendipita vermifera MAFF 305830]